MTNIRLTGYTSIHESQLGFTPGRSTPDANFGLIQTVEKYIEGQKYINLVFIDLDKTYDHNVQGGSVAMHKRIAGHGKVHKGDTGYVPRM